MNIKVKAHASVANVVCAFDVMGFALEQPYDEMELKLTNQVGTINITHIDNYQLPTQPNKNVAGVALHAFLNAYPEKNIGFDLIINKKIKPGSGIGSSAASAAGAVVAANQLVNNYFSKPDLVALAMEGEALASGAKHADNIAPCIYGGITIVRSLSPIDVVQIPVPNLFVCIIHPQIEVKTAEARKILPTQIDLKTASAQWANVAALVAGLMQNNYETISNSLQDFIIEPVRKKLIPNYDELKIACMQAGALGGGISGSGPSVFMFCKNEVDAINVEKAMQSIYTNTTIPFETYITKIKK